MSKGTAHGSPDGPRYIYGKENINWNGPKRASEKDLLQEEYFSPGNDFLLEDPEEQIKNHLLQNHQPMGNHVLQAFSDTSVHPSEIENVMYPFIYNIVSNANIQYGEDEATIDELPVEVADDISSAVTEALWDDEDTTYYCAYMYSEIPEEEFVDFDIMGYSLAMKAIHQDNFDDDPELYTGDFEYDDAIQSAYNQVPWDKTIIVSEDFTVQIIDN